VAQMALDLHLRPPFQGPGVHLVGAILHRVGAPATGTAPLIPRRPTSQLPQLLDELLATLDNAHGLCDLLGPSQLGRLQSPFLSIPLCPPISSTQFGAESSLLPNKTAAPRVCIIASRVPAMASGAGRGSK
jgi:hypothetical protein